MELLFGQTADGTEWSSSQWWVLVIWLGILGGCVGSFLNVVAYRLPRGMSLSTPGSACPSCGRPIRWFHNVPVIGWIVLRGQCYDCGQKISPWYPSIEMLVAAQFVIVALRGPLDDAANLAVTVQPDTAAATPWIVYGYQMVLLSTLVALALLDHANDRVRLLRTKSVWLVVAIGVGLPCWLPQLKPVAGLDEAVLSAGSASALVTGLLGMAWGGAVGWLVVTSARSVNDANDAMIVAGMVLGAYLGWQVTAAIFVAAAVLFLLSLMLGSAVSLHHSMANSLVALLAMLSFLSVCNWQQIGEWYATLSAYKGSTWLLLGGPPILLFLCGRAQRLTRRFGS